jgi:putative ABC transport system permease protein
LALTEAVRREVRNLDKDLAVSEIRELDTIAEAGLARQRFTLLMVGLFAVIALTLAAIGIYGVMSYLVAQRTHEMGIRLALGARQRSVMKLMLGQGMVLAGSGVAIGLAGAFALTRLMASLLYGVSTTDPLTFLLIAMLFVGVALLACYIPARRASTVDPMVALRYE